MTDYNGQDFHNWYKTPDNMLFTNKGYSIINPVTEISEDLKIKPFSMFYKNENLDAFLMFYQEDHKFNRVWNSPDTYIEAIRKHAGAFTPDFSLYADTPIPMQQWNHYRKQWCGAYWQTKGIRVIPTVGWSDEKSFDFCFEGIPHNSIVTVSALGTVNNKEARKAFLLGYNKMLEVLNPSKILLYSGARMKDHLDGPIYYIGNTKVR
jgi:hypothetical protein